MIYTRVVVYSTMQIMIMFWTDVCQRVDSIKSGRFSIRRRQHLPGYPSTVRVRVTPMFMNGIYVTPCRKGEAAPGGPLFLCLFSRRACVTQSRLHDRSSCSCRSCRSLSVVRLPSPCFLERLYILFLYLPTHIPCSQK